MPKDDDSAKEFLFPETEEKFEVLARKIRDEIREKVRSTHLREMEAVDLLARVRDDMLRRLKTEKNPARAELIRREVKKTEEQTKVEMERASRDRYKIQMRDAFREAVLGAREWERHKISEEGTLVCEAKEARDEFSSQGARIRRIKKYRGRYFLILYAVDRRNEEVVEFATDSMAQMTEQELRRIAEHHG